MKAVKVPSWRAFRVRDGSLVRSIRDLVRSEEVLKADALLLGETHDDPIAHEVERDLLREVADLPERKPMLSMEILERDVQLVVDEYVAGTIREQDFKSNARLPFNYDTDYREIIEMAREKGLRILATNAPRRYVSLARRVGIEALKDNVSVSAQKYLPPLPYASASERYANKFGMIMASFGGELPDKIPPPPPGMLAAQSLWDASMAHGICAALLEENRSSSTDRPLVFHIGGGFHVEHKLGILEHIPNYSPDTKVTTVVIQPGNPGEPFDDKKHKDIADFVIITDETVERSYEH